MKFQKTKNLFLFLFVVFGLYSAETQIKDPDAKALLSEVNEKVKSYSNIHVNFSYVLENQSENIRQETSGQVTLKDNKYVLNILGMQRIFDGKILYTISPEDEEVTISKNRLEEETIAPNSLFSFYEVGYNYQMDITQNKFGRIIQYIKLTPIEYDSEIKYALLGIDKKTKHIYNLIEIGKNNTKTTLTIDSFEINKKLPPNFFDFNPSKYNGYYINNLD